MPARMTSRRSLLKAAGLGLAGAGLTAAGFASGRDPVPPGRTTVRFLQTKPEAIGYFADLVDRYNASQDRVWVVHDSSQRSLVAQFVRDEPPDIACYNYNLEASQYVGQGALVDLGRLPEAGRIAPRYQDLVDQFARFRDETSVLPYSTTVAGTLYNTELFARHGVGVPRTWTELLAACRRLADRGVTPIYLVGDEDDGWPMTQGPLDYAVGGSVDVAAFYRALEAQDGAAGPVSFAGTLGPSIDRMLQLAEFVNPDFMTRGHADGNQAFARGEAAMYLSGPWSLTELDEIEPDLPVASFALPMTDDPADRKVRANLDLALWIPRASPHRAAAEDFLRYLLRPEVIEPYNVANLATSPMRGAPALVDARFAGLRPYVEADRLYQGVSTYLPKTIPVGNYLEEAFLTGDGRAFLETLDADWRRLAARTA